MSLEIQQQIKQNAQQIKEYVSALYDWEEEMELKEKAKKQVRSQEKAPIINDRDVKKESESTVPMITEKKKDLIRDVTTIGGYYKAWDQFDIDKELQRLQEEQKKAYRPYNPYEDVKNIQRAKPKAKITVGGSGRRGNISDPSALKDKGNLLFQSGQYSKAIQCYTECIDKLKQDEGENMGKLQKDKLLAVLYANKAMAQLKNNNVTEAMRDSNQAIGYNGSYSKAYYRRAECLKKQRKYRDSLMDYKKVVELQPGETKAKEEIQRITAYLSKLCKEARENLVVVYAPELLRGSQRIQIQEVQALQRTKQTKENYLQML